VQVVRAGSKKGKKGKKGKMFFLLFFALFALLASLLRLHLKNSLTGGYFSTHFCLAITFAANFL
jgi:hypothetical protein